MFLVNAYLTLIKIEFFYVYHFCLSPFVQVLLDLIKLPHFCLYKKFYLHIFKIMSSIFSLFCHVCKSGVTLRMTGIVAIAGFLFRVKPSSGEFT